MRKNVIGGVGLRFLVLVAFALTIAFVAKVSADDINAGVYRPKEEPRDTVEYVSSPKVEIKGGTGLATIAYPTGRKDNSVLWIEKRYPTTVRLGKPYSYTIKVTNLTALSVPNVVISEEIPAGFVVQNSDPAGRAEGAKMFWDLGNLDPKGSKLITITGMTPTKAELPCCTAATYDAPSLCVETAVVQPDLKLAVTTVPQVTACQSIPIDFVVTNPGDVAVSDVKVITYLADGLTVGGQNSFTTNVGVLGAGASKKYTETARPSRTGSFEIKANATSSDELSASAMASTSVVKPVLAVSAGAGRDSQFLGRDVNYTVTVSNQGNAVAESAVLSANLMGARAKSASENGKVSGSNVSWNLGDLQPGASKSFSVEGIAVDSGLAKIEAMAEGVCSEDASASAATKIIGIPAILLEVVDLEDPIEVGSEETYVITVTNQGSAPDTNIKVVAILDRGQQYVSSSGATKGTANGETVTFMPLSTLAPKDTATWRLVIKGTEVADARLKVVLNSDQLTKSVEETEATNIY